MVVEGIQVSLNGRVVVEHLAQRIKYHKERAAAYEAQVNALGSQGVEVDGFSGVQSSSFATSAIAELRDKVERHQDKAQAFAFLMLHLDTAETYRFRSAELAGLEFIERQPGGW